MNKPNHSVRFLENLNNSLVQKCDYRENQSLFEVIDCEIHPEYLLIGQPDFPWKGTIFHFFLEYLVGRRRLFDCRHPLAQSLFEGVLHAIPND